MAYRLRLDFDEDTMKRYSVPATAVLLVLAAGLSGAQTRPTSAPTSRPIRLLEESVARGLGAVKALRYDAAADKAVAERRDALKARLRGEADADEHILLLLAWANWELSEVASPAATRWILGFRERSDLERFAEVAESAGEHLDAAEKELDSLPESTERAVQRQRTRWGDTVKTLRRFAEGYKALAGAVPEDAAELKNAQGACRDAALELAELRESEDAELAAAAKLWQGVLLEAGGRLDRALAALDMVSVQPVQLPYDFYQRLLRAQLLQVRGSFALAEGLALRLAGECGDWFKSGDVDAGSAQAAVAALRVCGLYRWAACLRDTDAAEAGRLSEKAAKVAEKGGSAAKGGGLYRLGKAVPVLVEMPKAPAKRDAPATATGRSTTGSNRAHSFLRAKTSAPAVTPGREDAGPQTKPAAVPADDTR
jgi:hypothetical protein